jgi:hypothetical protein
MKLKEKVAIEEVSLNALESSLSRVNLRKDDSKTTEKDNSDLEQYIKRFERKTRKLSAAPVAFQIRGQIISPNCGEHSKIEDDEIEREEPAIVSELIKSGTALPDPFGKFFEEINGWQEDKSVDLNTKVGSGDSAVYKYLLISERKEEPETISVATEPKKMKQKRTKSARQCESAATKRSQTTTQVIPFKSNTEILQMRRKNRSQSNVEIRSEISDPSVKDDECVLQLSGKPLVKKRDDMPSVTMEKSNRKTIHSASALSTRSLGYTAFKAAAIAPENIAKPMAPALPTRAVTAYPTKRKKMLPDISTRLEKQKIEIPKSLESMGFVKGLTSASKPNTPRPSTGSRTEYFERITQPSPVHWHAARIPKKLSSKGFVSVASIKVEPSSTKTQDLSLLLLTTPKRQQSESETKYIDFVDLAGSTSIRSSAQKINYQKNGTPRSFRSLIRQLDFK